MRAMGVDWNPLLNGNHAMALVIMASVWKQISYNFLFFLAGLQSIPRSVIEAAAIDGARPVRRFWTIIFPLLSPTAFFLLVVNIVYVFFDTFGIIDAMTGGGPAKATETLVYKVFFDGRLGGNLGGSAAQSVILMVMVIAHDRRAVPLHRAQGDVLMGGTALSACQNPLPLVGRGKGWGEAPTADVLKSPPPCPSPTGGRGRGAGARGVSPWLSGGASGTSFRT